MNSRNIILPISLICCSLLIAFGLCEVMIRFTGHYDSDGNFIFLGKRLKPYHLPINQVSATIDKFMAEKSSCYLYDPSLGWLYRPNSKSHDGMYAFNSQGIRSPVDFYSVVPKQGVIRIALFGDSFTFGEEVPFQDTWGYLLEKRLNNKGIKVEVLNFGVGGYGMDQAYLRWEKMGKRFFPHIVMFGFQAENLRRNVSIIRALHWYGSKNPFTKPRFILKGNKLELMNSPAIPPEKLIDVLRNIQKWSLVQHEYFYDKKDFQKQIWFHSKLVSFFYCILVDDVPYARKPYFLDQSVTKLGYQILETFAEAVKSTGAEFIIVNIPKKQILRQFIKNRTQAGGELLAELEKGHLLIRTEETLTKEHSADDICQEHYTKKGNKILAKIVAERLVQMIDQELL